MPSDFGPRQVRKQSLGAGSDDVGADAFTQGGQMPSFNACLGILGGDVPQPKLGNRMVAAVQQIEAKMVDKCVPGAIRGFCLAPQRVGCSSK